MKAFNEAEDCAEDHDDNEDDDSWILNEAARWATTSEIKSQSTPDSLTKQVATASRIETSCVESMPKTKKDKTSKKRQQLTSAQHSDLQPPSTPQKDFYSVHVTQISFQATEDDIRQHFVQAGCIGIQSIRFVYDFTSHKDSTPKAKKFRGVAFVDLSDEQSYQHALRKLHGSLLLSRKINVRPVKSKGELANIVEKTQTIVSEKIRIEKEKKLQVDGTSNNSAKNKPVPPPKRKESTKGKASESHASPLKRKRDSGASPQQQHPSTKKASSNPSKLTKQQRNRRAAILLSKRKS